MVVTYKVHPITYRIMRALFTVSHVSLPNLLAKRGVVPELLQDEAIVEKLGPAVLAWFDDERRRASLVNDFDVIHETLRGGRVTVRLGLCWNSLLMILKQRIAGVDEAGRGPLAGPVVAAACVLGRVFRPRD